MRIVGESRPKSSSLVCPECGSVPVLPPYRSFKIWDGEEGGDVSIEEGRGVTLDDAIKIAIQEVRWFAENGYSELRLIIEGDILHAVVRQKPGMEPKVVMAP